MDLAAQKRAGGQHHGRCFEPQAGLCDNPAHGILLDHQVIDRGLEELQAFLVLQQLADGGLVQGSIRLRPSGANRRALARVQDAELDPGTVGRQRHCPAHGVDFPDQVALADPADGRVAAHLPEGLEVVGHQQRATSHARSRERRLGTGVSATDDDDLVVLRGCVHVRKSMREEQVRIRNPHTPVCKSRPLY